MTTMPKIGMLVAAASLWLAAAGVQGDWLVKTVIHDHSGDHAASLDCALTAKDGSVEGTCRGAGQGGPGIPVTGHVRGDDVQWHFDIAFAPNEPPHTATFTGTVNRSAHTMKGSFTISNRRGTFTATRR